ncbi:ABC transporter substrate-binding protein [Humibacter antri]
MSTGHPGSRFLRRALAGVAALAVVAALAACSSGTSNAAGSTGASSADALNLGLVGSVNDKVDPYASQASVGEGAIWRNMYDLLTYLDDKGKLQMGLAQSFTPSDGNKVWTVKLRPNVKLHDGGTFGADDVIFSVKRMFQLKSTFGAITQISPFVDPDQITKVNDLTVRFTLKEPYGVFPNAWSYEQLYMTGHDWTPENPDGTGPFTMKSFVPNRQATLTRFDGYWGKKPGFRTLNVYFFSDQQAIVNALQGGQIDLTNAVPLANVSSLKASGIQFLTSDSATHLSLDMRTDIAPFNDPRVREAMALIIDRQAVVKTAYNGYGKVGNDMDLGGGCAAPDVTQRKQDLAKAKQLLAAAGQSHLSVDLVTDGAFQGMLETAQLLSQDAAQIGVTVNVKKMDTGSMLDKWLQWPFVVNVVTADYLSGVPDHSLPGGQDNASHWNNAQFNSLAGTLFNTTDASQQCSLEQQMQKIQHDDVPSLIAAYPLDLTPHSSRVHGLQTDPFGRTSRTFGGVTVG